MIRLQAGLGGVAALCALLTALDVISGWRLACALIFTGMAMLFWFSGLTELMLGAHEVDLHSHGEHARTRRWPE